MALRFAEVSVVPGAPYAEAVADLVYQGMYSTTLIRPHEARGMHLTPDVRHFALLEDTASVAAAGGLEQVGEGVVCKLNYLVADPERPRRGLGRLMLTSLEAVARDNGAMMLVLDLLPATNPRAFYERLGYHQTPSDSYVRLLGDS